MRDDLLTIGIPKGRLMQSARKHFAATGIDISIAPRDARAVIVPTSEPDLQLCPIRSKDVALLLEAGVLDMAIVGSDTLFEAARFCYGFRVDLNICTCRMSLIGLPGDQIETRGQRRPKVATKYSQAARSYFAKLNIEPEIIPLHGSTELALLTGLAPFVVDIVSTGATIARNNLVELDVISPVAATALISHRTVGLRRQRCEAYIRRLMAPAPQSTARSAAHAQLGLI